MLKINLTFFSQILVTDRRGSASNSSGSEGQANQSSLRQIGSSHSPRGSVHSNRRGQNLPPRGSATSGPTDVEVHIAKCQKICFFAVKVPKLSKKSYSNHPFGH